MLIISYNGGKLIMFSLWWSCLFVFLTGSLVILWLSIQRKSSTIKNTRLSYHHSRICVI